MDNATIVMKARQALLPSVVMVLFALGASSTSGQTAEPCDRCKPAKAEWSWKANGYATGATPEAALALAKQQATDSACKKSATYLDANKLSCKGSCEAGDIDNVCAPDKTPGCNSGTYEENKGMWTFVCRKQNESAQEKVSCDKEEAAKKPGYTMCDVSVKAVRTLACTHPDCAPQTP